MPITVKPLMPNFGAEVTGLDLRQPVGPDLAAEVHRAIGQYGVLVFPGQEMDDDHQMAFGKALGPLEQTRATVDAHKHRLKHNEMNDISNLDEDGHILAADDRRRLFSLGNRLWHSDSSFKKTPALYSMLHGRAVPPEGGATEFADMRSVWDALPPAMQARLRDRTAWHSLLFSRALLGFTDYTAEERERFAPVPQRLVRRHAPSGRLSLFLSAHIGRIDGMPPPEAVLLVRELTEFATQRRFVYAHQWKQWDLVMWDNRCTMHRATPYDDSQYRRDMRRVTLQDVAPTLEQAA